MIYDGLPDYSIILHQTNCMGEQQGGLGMQLARKYPDWFQDYRNHCGWFRHGHQEELLGCFYAYHVNDKLTIVNAFAQLDVQRKLPATDYYAWQKILQKVERQVSQEKLRSGKPWTVHIQEGIGSGGYGGGDWEKMLEIFQYHFEGSDVELFIHSR